MIVLNEIIQIFVILLAMGFGLAFVITATNYFDSRNKPIINKRLDRELHQKDGHRNAA